MREELKELNRLSEKTAETIGIGPQAIVIHWFCARIVAQALVLGLCAIAQAIEDRP